MNFLKKLWKPKKTLLTHDGGFHTDDVLAFAILQIYFNKKGQRYIIQRSRENSMIEKADIVFDVGNKYIPEQYRFDHHQVGGAGKRENGIPYAACGLVWEHFGRELCSSEDTWRRIDELLIQPIDAHDTGFDISIDIVPGIHEFGIGYAVGCFAPADFDTTPKQQLRAFKKASRFMHFVLERIISTTEKRYQEQKIVLEKYQDTADKTVIEFEYNYGRGVWKVLSEFPETLYVIYPDSTGKWRLEGVKKPNSIFEIKKELPAPWRGLKDEELVKVTDVPDALFCHPAGFVAGAKSKEGVWMLAKKALAN